MAANLTQPFGALALLGQIVITNEKIQFRLMFFLYEIQFLTRFCKKCILSICAIR